MGLFEVLKETASRLLDDGSKENTLYSRNQGPDELLRLRFRLPEPETLMAQVSTMIRLFPLGVNAQSVPNSIVDEFYDGKASLSESFVMFEAQPDPRMLTFVIPLSAVRRVERLPSRSSIYALKVTLYQDLQLILQCDSMFSSCEQFCHLLGANLRAQVPLAKSLRQISATFYSEFLVEGALRRKRGDTREKIQAEIAVPPGGLGRDFGYPGDAKASHERSKMRLWLEYLTSHGRNVGMVLQPQFYKLIRVGLPNALRGELWELCCGSVHMRMKSRQLYASLLETNAGKTTQATEEIAKDLNRSLPEYPAYQSPEGIERLRRVLVAYSWMCPEVGYCQAMNIVTAALLIYQTEEQAFWTLHVLVHRVLPGYYSRTMYGMLLDQKVLETLVEKTMPILWNHLVAMDVPLSVVSMPWFLSLFANSMPLPYAFRIIDILMLEGSKALFQVSLAILRVNGERLLEAEDNTAVIEILKSYFDTLGEPANPRGDPERIKQITKFQELLVTSFKEFSVVTNEWIHDLRAKNEAPVLANIESYAKRTQIRNLPKTRNLGSQELSVVYDTFYTALQATRPGLGSNRGELDFYQFVTFLSQLADWVHPRIISREDAEHEKLLSQLFIDWASGDSDSLTLADCVCGLDRLVNPDMMELLNYIFSVFSKTSAKGDEANHTKTSSKSSAISNTASTATSSSVSSGLPNLNPQQILDVADGLLMMMRPFSESHEGAIMLDAQSSEEVSRLLALEQIDDKAELQKSRQRIIERLQQQQSAQYLTAVSAFIQRAYEVSGLKAVQPDLSGTAKITEATSLISLEQDNDSEKSEKAADEDEKTPPENGSLSLPHFRMVVLADETLERFFSETLRSTIHLTEQGTGVLSNKFSAGAFRSMMDNVMREGLQLADGLWRVNTPVSDAKDDLDDVSVSASDRALLDI